MKTYLDLGTWNRKEHFDFFRRMDEPFFGLVAQVEVTQAYQVAKELGVSFFTYYLHQSLRAANEVEAFRYRMEGDQVACYEAIHASATVGRPDTTFGFTFIEYSPELPIFAQRVQGEVEAVQQSSGLRMTDNASRPDTIHYSSIPWASFTGLSHARSFTHPDSCPKISFGKYEKTQGRLMMSVSIHAHHALMDGYHVGQYLDRFQALLNASV